MNPQVEPQQKNKKTNPPLSFSSSLPNDIVVNCLARVSRSYYPKLSLVCKNFRSLILSKELHAARYHFRTIESVLHVCLQLSDHLRPYWFSLWIKPDQTLTNDIGKKQKKSTGNTLLVPTPSSYFPCVPMFIVTAGSEQYALNQYNAPSPALWVRNKELFWRKASNTTVARERAVLGVLDEKIYVMGGCGANETANWAEVFDPKTQTWEPLPDPGAEIRSSGIRKIEGIQGKLYVRCNEKKDYVYDTKQGKWDVAAAKGFVKCVIGNVLFGCDKKRCLWYDTKRKERRPVRGLSTLNRSRGGDFVEIANYRGKLLILWDKFVHQGRCQFKNIWCAVIALERRNDDDDVWGNIEWANVVLTVPTSYVFLRSRLNAI